MRKLVYLEWVDATGEGGWVSPEDQATRLWDPALVESIGIIVKEKEDSITICHSRSYGGHINGYITIPKGWIRKRKVIRV